MRILSATVANIAGLADATVRLPNAPVSALAGPNGSGKTTLLFCLLAPWLNNLPKPDDTTRESRVSITLELNSHEKRELELLSEELGMGENSLPDTLTHSVMRQPRAGVHVQPSHQVLQRGLQDVRFLERVRSLDVLFLPAERRLGRRDGGNLNLETLTPAKAVERLRATRSEAFSEAGRLDEHEFEAWATALCVAGFLPQEISFENRQERVKWSDFRNAVDTLLAPKRLLPVDASHPTTLRVGLPSGRGHPISDLSSGERQALIILGSVFRAGASRTVTIIDEPDVHLHPQLASPLLAVLRQLRVSQLIVATHSPLILDAVPPAAIVELRSGVAPRPLTSEGQRLQAYRHAGFRVSEISQASHVVVTEGEFDVQLLRAAEPGFERAAIRSVGGRREVIRLVADLSRFDLPVTGVIDRDLVAPDPPEHLKEHITVWPRADIEGTLLGDDRVLQTIVDRGLAKPEYGEVTLLRGLIGELVNRFEDNAVAEFAGGFLRAMLPNQFPSPRGEAPLARLREHWSVMAAGVDEEGLFVDAVSKARQIVAEAADLLDVVRGKWIIDQFAGTGTIVPDGANLLLALARDEAVRSLVAPALPQERSGAQEADVVGGETADPRGEWQGEWTPPRTEQLDRQRLLVRRVGGPGPEIEARILEELQNMRATLADAEVAIAGSAVLRYSVAGPDALEVDIGLPVNADVTPPAGLSLMLLPRCEAVSVDYRGPYAGVVEAHDAIHQWLNERSSRSVGNEPPWEVISPPSSGEDEWRVRVTVPFGIWDRA